jgi:hypothetical protein
MGRIIKSFVCAAALGAGSAYAAEPPAASVEKPAAGGQEAVSVEDNGLDIQTATCRDLFDLYDDAVPGEGKDPAAVERAQDGILLFVVWVHGYLSGRDGIDAERRPLSKEGIEITVKQIGEACEPDESKRFLDVINDIGR